MLNPANMSIGSRTRSFRNSRRGELLEGQWQQRRFEQHREKVKKAQAIVDDKQPLSATFQHVQVKQKKQQHEAERYVEVMMSNLILLRHLAEIAMSKRVNDGREQRKMDWKDYYGTLLLMRRQQVERLRGLLMEKEKPLSVGEAKEADKKANSDNTRKKSRKTS